MKTLSKFNLGNVSHLSPNNNSVEFLDPKTNNFNTAPLKPLRADHGKLIDLTLKVLDQEIDVGIDVAALSKVTSASIVDRFNESTLKTERKDGVPGLEIGSTQYGKTPDEYMALAAETDAEIRRIVGGYDSEVLAFFRSLASRLEQENITLRPALHKSSTAPLGRAVVWTDNTHDSKYMLRPHDDFAQVGQYENFEIGHVSRVIPINFYPSSSPSSGQLVVSNWSPTREERFSLGLDHTGYPIPDEIFEAQQSLTIPINSGTAIVADGGKAHGVLSGNGLTKNRLLVNVFLGVLNGKRSKEIIYWA